ncbi:FtsK/SpoIIIE domain-containing protein [Kineococcus sp. NUM-3379]
MRGQRGDVLLVPQVRLSLWGVLAVNLGRLLLRLGVAVLWHPLVAAVVLAAWALWAWAGWAWLLLAFGVVALVLTTWGLVWPVSFGRYVAGPARSSWRGWWRYRRHWQPVMVTAGLSLDYDGHEYLPRLRKVQCAPCRDSLLVQLLAGQSPADYESRADALAHTLGASSCRVRVDRPGWVWLDVTHADPLCTPVAALLVAEVPDLLALPLGVAEDGAPWCLRLLGTHVLVAGATGAGKGSVLWSLIRSLCGGIRSGLVQVWAVDPKGGMELTFGTALFTRFAYRTTDDMLLLLEDAVAVMRRRQERLLGVTRLHEPSTDEPLVVVLVDELAALTAYSDRETRKKAAELLQLLLSQGRAVGVLVVAALQDPGKDVLPFRDLFPTRIALRLTEDVQVDMILGRGARERGAVCDRIPESLPGVGFVQVEGRREPVRVRAAHVTDEDLAAMVRDYSPAAPVSLVKDES